MDRYREHWAQIFDVDESIHDFSGNTLSNLLRIPRAVPEDFMATLSAAAIQALVHGFPFDDG